MRGGSAAFSVRKVAQAAGMSLGNLQYHFGSKVELLGGLLDADIAEYRGMYEQMRLESEEAGRRGRAALHGFIALALNDVQLHEQTAVFRALYSFTEPEIIERLHTYYAELHGLLQEGLAALAGVPVESRVVARSSAILFPYLDGFDSTAELLAITPAEISDLLTEIVWSILQSEDKK